MRPIPPKVKQELSNDPYMKRCCLCGSMFNKISPWNIKTWEILKKERKKSGLSWNLFLLKLTRK